MTVHRCTQLIAPVVMCGMFGCRSSIAGSDRSWSAHLTGAVFQMVNGSVVSQAKVTIQGINLDGSNAVSRGKCTGGVLYPVVGHSGDDGRYDVSLEGAGPPGIRVSLCRCFRERRGAGPIRDC